VKNQNLIESVEIPAETRNTFENVEEIARNGCFRGPGKIRRDGSQGRRTVFAVA
jgi:hypothetical protein